MQSVVAALAKSGLSIPLVTAAVAKLPLSALGFGWVAPAVFGLVLGLFLSRRTEKLEKTQ